MGQAPEYRVPPKIFHTKPSRTHPLKRAGLKAKTKSNLLLTVKRAILKLEAQTDHREISRKVGLGKAEVARGYPDHDQRYPKTPGESDHKENLLPKILSTAPGHANALLIIIKVNSPRS